MGLGGWIGRGVDLVWRVPLKIIAECGCLSIGSTREASHRAHVAALGALVDAVGRLAVVRPARAVTAVVYRVPRGRLRETWLTLAAPNGDNGRGENHLAIYGEGVGVYCHVKHI